mgnify:CR=1 FL=1
MIQYKFPEEKHFILHYAQVLDRPKITQIIEAGCVKSSEEASLLASFFWEMVDEIVKDKERGNTVAGQTDLEAWNEYVFESIRSYLRNNGYKKEWDDEV